MVGLHGREASAWLRADSTERYLVFDATRGSRRVRGDAIGGNRSNLLPRRVRWVPRGSEKTHACGFGSQARQTGVAGGGVAGVARG